MNFKYLEDKYINHGLNSKFLLEFLVQENYLTQNRKELAFRISQLTPIQLLSVFYHVVNGINIDGGLREAKIKLTDENIDLFFEVYFVDQYNSNDGFRLKCDNNFWKELSDFYDNNSKKQDKQTAYLFEKEWNKKITELSNKILESLIYGVRHKNETNWFHYIHNDILESTSKINCLIEGFQRANDYSVFCVPNFFDYQETMLYNIKLEDKRLGVLYDLLEKNNFIDIEKTSSDDWFNVLTKKTSDHDSIVYLNMDNPQTSFFISQLKVNLNVDISLTKLEKMKNIYNKNGEIKAASVYASANYNKKHNMFPKESDLIIEIVKKV